LVSELSISYSKVLTRLLVLRALKNIAKNFNNPSQAASTVAEAFKENFTNLKQKLLSNSTIRTDINVSEIRTTLSRVMSAVDVIGMDLHSLMQRIGSDYQQASEQHFRKLDDVCTELASYNSDKACLPGTRQGLLDEIHNWINNDSSSQRALLLTGEAGTGKSAVANSISRLYDGIGCLGSAYCFNRTEAKLTSIDMVIPTIARNLASCEPQVKAALSRIIEDKPTKVQTRGIGQQFVELLLDPLRQATIIRPVVVVIDALDESDPTTRHHLLKALKDNLANLPLYIRIIITSRLEFDINEALGKHNSVCRKQMGDISISSTTHDISQYIYSELQDSQSLFTDYEATCNDLVEAAGTLFQWAYTACRIIKGYRSKMQSIEEQVQSILSSKDLDELYTNTLLQVFGNGTIPDRYRIVMSHVLAAIEPLSIPSLDDLLVQSGVLQKGEVNIVIRELGALLSGTDHSHRVVRPLHTSFRDFLVDERRSSKFAIQLGPTQDLSFVRGCLLILNNQLCFNMCNLETSYKLNSDYVDLPQLLIQNTSASMAYAAVHWGRHLEKIANSNTALVNDISLCNTIKDLLEKKGLFWIEVLSLLKKLKAGSSTLSIVGKYIQSIQMQVC
jgi:hypothetical protein